MSKIVKYKIVAYRKEKNYTQKDMARKLDIALATYQRWENNPKEFRMGKALELTKILDVSLEELFLV